MKGLLTRQPDGTLTARLRDKWGFEFALTGTKAEGGYEVEVKLAVIPDSMSLPGDEDAFEVER